jgi:hypothetical protein
MPKLNSNLAVNLQNLAYSTKSFNRRKQQFDALPEKPEHARNVVDNFMTKNTSMANS